MPLKVKVIIGFLVLFAVFTGYIFIQSVNKSPLSTKRSTKTQTNTKLSWKVENDTDKDGLSNKEESYWNTDFENPDTDEDGFLDGEEVVSGHSPTVPGPDDLMTEPGIIHSKNDSDTTNLTEKLALLITSGTYAGDLKRDTDKKTYAKSINDLSLSMLYDGLVVLSPNESDFENIKIAADKKSVQEKYISGLFKIIENDLLEEIIYEPFEAPRLLANFETSNKKKTNETKIFFRSKAANMRKVSASISQLEVPQLFMESHKDILSFLKSLELIYDSIGGIDNDPVKALIAYRRLQGIYLESQPILSSLVLKIRENKLNVPETQFFKLIKNINGF